MKKYLSGIVAVILAISFSAFTITPKTVSGKLTDYRWAKTNLDGNGIKYFGNFDKIYSFLYLLS